MLPAGTFRGAKIAPGQRAHVQGGQSDLAAHE